MDGPGERRLADQLRELEEAHRSLQLLTDTLSARIEELEGERSRVLRLGRIDALTSLLNREAFRSGLTEKLAAADRFGTAVALLAIDLDRFKDANDALGREAGDEILQTVAARLVEGAREGDLIARLGGDEFAILAEMRDGGEAGVLAERLLAALHQPIEVGGRSIAPGASIGLALYPAQAKDAGEMQRFADMALHRAKAEGRGAVSVFDETLRQAGERRRAFEADLRRAVGAGEIVPWFQPVVEASSGAVSSLEVLARWPHPTEGMIGPDRFIPVAEEIGLIQNIDAAILDAACRAAAPWVAEGLIGSIACNVSPRQLVDADFAEGMIARIEASGFPPNALVVEITETFLLQDMALARRHIERLAECGVRVALDDFGIGYSNLRALMQLPISVLKVDRSLTQDVGADGRMAALFRLLAQTSRALGMDMVAEGVEDEAQAIRLRAAGCEKMQGYWFARPMPPEAMDAFLRNQDSGARPGRRVA